MDKGAEACGMDPMEFRILNAYRDGDMKAHRRVAKNTALIECVQVARKKARWPLSEQARRQSSLADGGGARAEIPATPIDENGRINRRRPVADGRRRPSRRHGAHSADQAADHEGSTENRPKAPVVPQYEPYRPAAPPPVPASQPPASAPPPAAAAPAPAGPCRKPALTAWRASFLIGFSARGGAEMALFRGRGMASVNYPIGMNLGGDPSQALIHSNPDGKFTVALSAIDLGQGMKQVTRQVAAETLGVPIEDVYVDTADSDTGPHDMGSFASRGTHRMGNAVIAAAREARGVLLDAAAEELEVNASDLVTDGKGNIHVKARPRGPSPSRPRHRRPNSSRARPLPAAASSSSRCLPSIPRPAR